VHPDNHLLGFLSCSAVDALRAVELRDRGEFLLVFQTLGVYVDAQGRKSRDRELMYPAVPLAVGVLDNHLLVYSETHVDVFDVVSGDWIQTINLKKARPLNDSGSITVCAVNDLTYIVYFSRIGQSKSNNRLFIFPTACITRYNFSSIVFSKFHLTGRTTNVMYSTKRFFLHVGIFSLFALWYMIRTNSYCPYVIEFKKLVLKW